MSAVAYKLPYQPARPHLELLPALPEVLRPSAAVLRRRRIVAALVAGVVVLVVASFVNQGVSWALHQATQPAHVASVSQLPISTSRPTTWTVRPGDTLWAIAHSVQPTGDSSGLVQKLMAQYKDRPLQVGQTITIPQ